MSSFLYVPLRDNKARGACGTSLLCNQAISLAIFGGDSGGKASAYWPVGKRNMGQLPHMEAVCPAALEDPIISWLLDGTPKP